MLLNGGGSFTAERESLVGVSGRSDIRWEILIVFLLFKSVFEVATLFWHRFYLVK